MKVKISFSKLLIRDRREVRRNGIKTGGEIADMADATMSSFDWIGTAYTEIGIRVKERNFSLLFFNPRAFDRNLKKYRYMQRNIISTLIPASHPRSNVRATDSVVQEDDLVSESAFSFQCLKFQNSVVFESKTSRVTHSLWPRDYRPYIFWNY